MPKQTKYAASKKRATTKGDNRLLLIGGGIAAVVVVLLLVILNSNLDVRPSAATQVSGKTWGKADAKVTIEEFGDFQ